MVAKTTQIDARGQMVIPKDIRQRFGLSAGSLLLVESTPEGILLRPAKAVPTRLYTPKKMAALLLEDAIDATSYAHARKVVTEMGLDPDKIPHERPAGTNKSVS